MQTGRKMFMKIFRDTNKAADGWNNSWSFHWKIPPPPPQWSQWHPYHSVDHCGLVSPYRASEWVMNALISLRCMALNNAIAWPQCCKQLLSITLLSTQDGGRHSGQGRLQRLFLTSMHVSKGYPCPPDSLQYVGFTGVICWSADLFSGRNRAD